jgi:hypothetical protein
MPNADLFKEQWLSPSHPLSQVALKDGVIISCIFKAFKKKKKQLAYFFGQDTLEYKRRIKQMRVKLMDETCRLCLV